MFERKGATLKRNAYNKIYSSNSLIVLPHRNQIKRVKICFRRVKICFVSSPQFHLAVFSSSRDINAFLYDATVLEYLAGHDDGCKLRTVGNWYAMTGYGVAFPQGSKWIDVFNKFLVEFQNNGKIAFKM